MSYSSESFMVSEEEAKKIKIREIINEIHMKQMEMIFTKWKEEKRKDKKKPGEKG